MGEFSLVHWVIILVILLIFFGPSKLPGLGKSMGEAIRGFKKGLSTDEPTGDAQRDQIASAEKKREQEAYDKEKSRN